MLLNTILWMVFGALVGWVANIMMKRNSQMGAIANIFVGVTGAAFGGLLIKLFGTGDLSGFNFYYLLLAILSAAVLLFLVGLTQSDATL